MDHKQMRFGIIATAAAGPSKWIYIEQLRRSADKNFLMQRIF